MVSMNTDAISLPFGKNAKIFTQFKYPFRVCNIALIDGSKNLTVLFSDIDIMSIPSGKNTTVFTSFE